VLTSIAVLLTLFGASIVFVLLIAKTVQGLYNQIIDSTNIHNYCVIVVLVVLVLWPITMLESPKDFWSVLAYYLLIIYAGTSLLAHPYLVLALRWLSLLAHLCGKIMLRQVSDTHTHTHTHAHTNRHNGGIHSNDSSSNQFKYDYSADNK
jgi:hypothetical protein